MANAFTEIGGDLFGTLFSSVIYFGIGFIFVVVVGIIMWYFIYYRRKFDISVKIKSQRAGDPEIYFDKAGILYDRKEKSKYFRLLNTKVDLQVPKFEVLQKSNKGDYLEIFRKSEDDFRYLTPPAIIKDRIIKEDGKVYSILDTEQRQLEPDAYWFISRKDRLKRLFDPENLLMKILPWIPQIASGILIIFVLWILMDKLPAILSELTTLTQELRSLKGADITTFDLAWSLLKF